ncbi:MAG TPA: hypothetical protein VE961_04305 [Pyrinomonadaceae bacterium]|nr:hypothetical protein [Pyrinomonadaceae bacterium]
MFGPTNQSTVAKLLMMATSLLVFALLLWGCGKSASTNAVHLKYAAGEKDLAIKSAYAFPVTKSFTDVNGKVTTAAAYKVYLANYDLDAKNFGLTLEKPLASDDQVRLVFSLVGAEGTDEKSALKGGTYLAKADKYLKAESAGIVSRKGGADVTSWLDRSMLNGEVTISSTSADEINGDLSLSSGDMSLKGSFTAKVLKRK